MQTGNMQTRKMLYIKQAQVLSLDDADTRYAEADILIENGRILAIGADLGAKFRGDGIDIIEIEAKGMLAMPGLINSHFHSPGSFLKGRLNNLPLELFMLFEVPPLAATGDVHRYSYLCTQLAALEMLQRGITSVHDDAYHVPVVTHDSIDAIMQAYKDTGIRATVAIDQPNVIEYDKLPFLYDLLPDGLRKEMADAPLQSGGELISEYQYLIDRWHGAENGRLSAAVSCSAPQRVTPEYMAALSSLSRRYDLPFNLHILETKLQRVLGEEKYGKSLVQVVHDLGVLDERCQVIHAIWIDDNDIRLLAKSGCTVAHNPICNLRLGSGVMPFAALRDAGVPVAIGTDELCSDDSANLWFAGKTAALIHTLSTSAYDHWPQAPDILKSLTRAGARALRKEKELGQLIPGALADIILLDLDTWAFTPLNNLERQLIYCEEGSSVRYTIVNGEIVYANGQFPSLDVSALRQEIRALSPQIQSLFAATEAYAKRLWPYYSKMVEQAHAKKVSLTRRLLDSE